MEREKREKLCYEGNLKRKSWSSQGCSDPQGRHLHRVYAEAAPGAMPVMATCSFLKRKQETDLSKSNFGPMKMFPECTMLRKLFQIFHQHWDKHWRDSSQVCQEATGYHIAGHTFLVSPVCLDLSRACTRLLAFRLSHTEQSYFIKPWEEHLEYMYVYLTYSSTYSNDVCVHIPQPTPTKSNIYKWCCCV